MNAQDEALVVAFVRVCERIATALEVLAAVEKARLYEEERRREAEDAKHYQAHKDDPEEWDP